MEEENNEEYIPIEHLQGHIRKERFKKNLNKGMGIAKNVGSGIMTTAKVIGRGSIVVGKGTMTFGRSVVNIGKAAGKGLQATGKGIQKFGEGARKLQASAHKSWLSKNIRQYQTPKTTFPMGKGKQIKSGFDFQPMGFGMQPQKKKQSQPFFGMPPPPKNPKKPRGIPSMWDF